jgi:(1->4)-alpha-D-glucan 1-alpha-D-glucosylmutase
MEAFLVKALREAKRHTSWVHVDEAYEAAALSLLGSLLVPGGAFLTQFRPLARRLAFLGMLTGLSRTVLKCTVPGVPDFYQGTEMWDLALVDPDNRRAVDYDSLGRSIETQEPAPVLLARWRDGQVKQQVLARLLADRAATPNLYAYGDYHILKAGGSFAKHVVAFSRTNGSERLAVVVPRLVAKLAAEETAPLGAVWRDTSVAVPAGRWRDIITGDVREIGPDGCPVSELFAALPFSVLRLQP